MWQWRKLARRGAVRKGSVFVLSPGHSLGVDANELASVQVIGELAGTWHRTLVEKGGRPWLRAIELEPGWERRVKMSNVDLPFPGVVLGLVDCFATRSFLRTLAGVVDRGGILDRLCSRTGLPNVWTLSLHEEGSGHLDRLNAIVLVLLLHAVGAALLGNSPLKLALARYLYNTDKHMLMVDCKAVARRTLNHVFTALHHAVMVPLTLLAVHPTFLGERPLAAPFTPSALGEFCAVWWSGHLLWALLSSLRNAELEHDLFAAQCTISLAATLAISLLDKWHWLLVVFLTWAFFLPLLSLRDAIVSFRLESNRALVLVATVTTAIYFWVIISYGWLAGATVWGQAGSAIKGEGIWGRPVGMRERTPAVLTALGAARVLVWAQLGLSHLWLASVAYKTVAAAVGLNLSTEEAPARVPRARPAALATKEKEN